MSATAKRQTFTMVPDNLLMRQDLSAAAKLLYSRLDRLSRVPTTKKVAELIGETYNVTRKAITELLNAGMLRRVSYGTYEVVAYDDLVVPEDNQVIHEDNPTRETERNRKQKPARAAQEGEEMVALSSYGGDPDSASTAEDLSRPRKGRVAKPLPEAVEQWRPGHLARYMDKQATTLYPTRAFVTQAKVAGYLRHCVDKGATPVECKAVIDVLLGNPAHVESATDLSTLLLRKFDVLLAQIRATTPDSERVEVLDDYSELYE